MQITISGRHLEVTEALNDYVKNKLDRLTNHFDRITGIQVTLSVDKLIQKAEATVHVSGKDLFAESTSEDLYAAIDLLADKLDRQLIKHKEKLRSHR
jgi:putative sigma-54 modulation protein